MKLQKLLLTGACAVILSGTIPNTANGVETLAGASADSIRKICAAVVALVGATVLGISGEELDRSIREWWRNKKRRFQLFKNIGLVAGVTTGAVLCVGGLSDLFKCYFKKASQTST